MSQNISRLSQRKGMQDSLFNRLVDHADNNQNHISSSDKTALAKEFLMGDAIIQGSVNFYDFIHDDAHKIKARVCNGSSCLCAGTQKAVTQVLQQHLPDEAIGHITCLGRCHENAAFSIKGHNFSGDAIDQVSHNLTNPNLTTPTRVNPAPEKSQPDSEQFQALIETQIKNDPELITDTYHCQSLLSSPILMPNTGLGPFEKSALKKSPLEKSPQEKSELVDFYAPLFDAMTSQTPEDILQNIIDSKLRGRGGAGFPLGLKWQSCRQQIASQKFIVCNADEGDPGAYSDRYLLEKQPHSVLLGMMLAGFLCGANTGILYIRAEYPQAIDSINQAIKQLQQLRYLGENILGDHILGDSDNGLDFNFEFKVVKGAGAYICGEETALLRSIEGQRPVVSVRPPFPTVSGLFQQPTVVNNVESFASIRWILSEGGNRYAQLGSAQSTGTKLISLDSSFNRPGIYEIEMGTPLSQVIEQCGQGFSQPTKALQIGGPLGGIVPSSYFQTLTVDFESFQQHGFLLGHASIVGIPESMPMIDYIQHLFQFTADESCGKCFPCRLGATRGSEMMQQAMQGKRKLNKELLNDLLETLEIGSLCALGGGVPLPVQNTLEHFADEFSSYFEEV